MKPEHRELPRVASLLPSATEIVCAVGGRSGLVGVSHECDHPPGLGGLPVLTSPRRTLPAASGAIDRAVREMLEDALAVYEVDVEALRRAAPEVIVTQDLCEVCAVSLDDVRTALAEWANRDVEVVSLSPSRLQHVWDDLRRVGAALGRSAAGEAAAARLEERSAAIAARAAQGERPSVLTIEWLEPVMIGGTWMPELVSLAGGEALVTTPGQHAPTLALDALAAIDPDVVLVKPCGFDLSRIEQELELLARHTPWGDWRAVRDGHVFAADGCAFFNRPGPRLLESLEILASCLHPQLFPELVARHRGHVRRVGRDLSWLPVGTE